MKGGGLHPILGTVVTTTWRDCRKLGVKSLGNIQPPSLKRRPFKYDAGSLTSVRNRGREREKVGQQTTSLSCLGVVLGARRTHQPGGWVAERQVTSCLCALNATAG
jgi:hypothetical protein